MPRQAPNLVGHLVWQVDGLLRRNDGELCGGPEGSIGLGSVQPHATADLAGVETGPTESTIPDPSLWGMTRGYVMADPCQPRRFFVSPGSTAESVTRTRTSLGPAQARVVRRPAGPQRQDPAGRTRLRALPPPIDWLGPAGPGRDGVERMDDRVRPRAQSSSAPTTTRNSDSAHGRRSQAAAPALLRSGASAVLLATPWSSIVFSAGRLQSPG
jgi:hypothetical protein